MTFCVMYAQKCKDENIRKTDIFGCWFCESLFIPNLELLAFCANSPGSRRVYLVERKPYHGDVTFGRKTGLV